MKKESIELFPVFLFFFCTFYLINFTDGLMHKSQGITPYSFFSVFVAAGVMAKIVLIVDLLPITKRFFSSPLLAKIFFKTFIYWCMALVMRMIELFLPYLFDKEGFYNEYEHFVQHVDWWRFWGIQIWCLILFFIFVAYRELYRRLGAAQMRKIFLEKGDE